MVFGALNVAASNGAGTVSATQAASVLVRLNHEGIVTLAVTGGVGAGIGALIAHRKLVGAIVGGALGIGLPIAASLLILLPLRKLTIGKKTNGD